MILSTSHEIANKEIIETKGLVIGVIIRTPTIVQGVLGGLKNIVGGKNSSYTEVCLTAREHAEKEMISQAEKLGANAIISVRFDSSGLGGTTSGTEVLCYGTAVIIR